MSSAIDDAIAHKVAAVLSDMVDLCYKIVSRRMTDRQCAINAD